MKTLDEYEKLATAQIKEDQGYFTTDVSIRMHILAMQDFLDELPDRIKDIFSFDYFGSLYVREDKTGD